MIRRLRDFSGGGRTRLDRRWMTWAAGRKARVAGQSPWEILVEVGSAASRHRVTGIAAEMSFFATLGLVPLTVAFGTGLAYVERIVGSERIAEGRDASITVLTTLLGPELTADVAPFVRTQLAQERGGLTAGSLVVALWLGSRMFMPAMHALNLAYRVEDRSSGIHRRLVSLGLAVGSLTASLVVLTIMIVGPLLGRAQAVADQLRLGGAYRVAWMVGRWPLLLIVVVGFLACLYRVAANARPRWRDCVPGAVLGMVAWILVAFGFRLYLGLGGQPGRGVGSEEEVIVTVGRTVAAVVATMLWTFLSSLAILLGGEVNAFLLRRVPVTPK